MTVKEMKQQAKIKGVKNWWLLNKEQLIEALTEKVEFECQIEPTALNIKGGTKMNELENINEVQIRDLENKKQNISNETIRKLEDKINIELKTKITQFISPFS